jgi:hypothetical protein
MDIGPFELWLIWAGQFKWPLILAVGFFAVFARLLKWKAFFFFFIAVAICFGAEVIVEFLWGGVASRFVLPGGVVLTDGQRWLHQGAHFVLWAALSLVLLLPLARLEGFRNSAS